MLLDININNCSQNNITTYTDKIKTTVHKKHYMSDEDECNCREFYNKKHKTEEAYFKQKP